MAESFPDIIGTGDAARILRVSRQQIERLAKDGKIRYKDTSTGKVFLRSDVNAYKVERDRKYRQPKKRIRLPKR